MTNTRFHFRLKPSKLFDEYNKISLLVQHCKEDMSKQNKYRVFRLRQSFASEKLGMIISA